MIYRSLDRDHHAPGDDYDECTICMFIFYNVYREVFFYVSVEGKATFEG